MTEGPQPQEGIAELVNMLIEGRSDFSDLEIEFFQLIPVIDDPVVVNKMIRGAIISCIVNAEKDSAAIIQFGLTPFDESKYNIENIHTHPDARIHAQYIVTLIQRIYYGKKRSEGKIDSEVYRDKMGDITSMDVNYHNIINSGSTASDKDFYCGMTDGFDKRLNVLDDFDNNLKMWYEIAVGIETRTPQFDIVEKGKNRFKEAVESGKIDYQNFISRFVEFTDSIFPKNEIIALFDKMLDYYLSQCSKEEKIENLKQSWMYGMLSGMYSYAKEVAHYAGGNNPIDEKYLRWINIFSEHYNYYVTQT